MATWEVTLPIAGIAYLMVEADNEEAAIEAALGECDRQHLEEWSAYREIVRGNVLYAPVNRASAERSATMTSCGAADGSHDEPHWVSEEEPLLPSLDVSVGGDSSRVLLRGSTVSLGDDGKVKLGVKP